MRALIVAMILMFASVAHAGPKPKVVAEAGKRFARGNELYEQGKYQEALLNYQAAYELIPALAFLFNRGLAKAKTLEHAGCVLDFEQYVAEGGPDADQARSHAAGCRTHVRLPVTITSVPAGVRISQLVGDQKSLLGRTPATIELAPGPYEITLELDGYEEFHARFDVVIGNRHGYDFPLVKLSTLRIDTDVPGATVTIDDGPPEPAPVDRVVRAGSYRIRASAPGHAPVDKTAIVAVGADVQLSLALPVLPTKQSLRLRTVPGGVIAIDGRPAVGEVELGAGLHVVEATASGRVAFHGQIVVPAGEAIEAVVKLPSKRTTLQRALLWGGAGAAATFALGGGIYGVLALDAEAEYADTDMPGEVRDRGLAFRFAADLLLGTAVVVGVVTAVYGWMTRPGAASLEVQR